MEVRRPQIDALAFALALAALGTATLGFVATRNGAAVVMCGLCLAGLVGGRVVGIPGFALLPVAIGLDVILWLVWIDPPAGSHTMSAFAHGAGGALAGWAIAETLRGRLRWPLWAIGAIVAVVCLAVAWELGEFIGDRVLDTSLIPSRRDSALDIFFGGLGATSAVALVCLLAPRRGAGSRT
ncbi:MAG: hypothetical protein GEU88_17155 [Solirubrobacterales bacterium]|nr:hypothetical protein [Solirubrobacterales bacterium]